MIPYLIVAIVACIIVAYVGFAYWQICKLADLLAGMLLPIILAPLGFRREKPFRMLGTQAWLRMVEMRSRG